MSERATKPVYANVVQMHLGPFDITMDFGYKSPEDAAREQAARDGSADASDNESPYSLVARISMSHAHAKAMLPILARLIAEFEKQAGTIPSPGFEQRAKE